jgi:UDP-N-acetylmuramate--alanine ligase
MRMFLKRMHFIGIGGAGMSALAEIVRLWGCTVSGSDSRRTPLTERLATLEIGLQYNHEPALIKDADVVIYSSAIRADNPEMAYARAHGLKLMRRAEMLGDLMRSRFSIAIAGTHGKTTTTALTGHLFSAAKRDPVVLVGGTLRENNANAVIGKGTVLIAEADEFDRSFLAMYPTVAIITNIDADHLDCYRDIADIRAAFIAFTRRVPFYGAVILCADDPGAAGIRPEIDCAVITYGISDGVDYQAQQIVSDSTGSRFSVVNRGRHLGDFSIPLSGLHNVRNALAAIAAANELGIDSPAIGRGLATFAGVRRRFEVVGTERGVCVVDDYAHHPAEISATLAAARERGGGRVVAVFQPHLYSRTRDLLDDFAASLRPADIVFVNAIYKAREEPIPGVSGAAIVEKINATGHHCAVYVEAKESIPGMLAPLVSAGDCVIMMGAGDINAMCAPLLERIRNG